MLINKISTIWKNKVQILEALKNNIFKKEHVEEIAKERIAICRSNKCGYYDKDGSSPKAMSPGSESCGDCGCILLSDITGGKTRCLSCKCPQGLWDAILTQDESDKYYDQLNGDNQ